MSTEIMLPEKLDTATAAELQEMLAAAGESDLVLKASQVTQLGGLCLEVLLSAAKTANSAGKSLTVSEPSDKFAEHLAVFGLDISAFSSLEDVN